MHLYPAIDIYGGEVVRLEKGDFQKKTVYSANPKEIAVKWQDEGARWIHLVDLEGAKTGQIKNWSSLEKIRSSTSVNIEFGGGIRKIDDLKALSDLGINRMILGTKALEMSFLEQALNRFADKIAVGLDVKNGFVQTQGWIEAENLTLFAAINLLNNFPLKTLIYTDIHKDGMLQGPNFESLKEVLQQTKANVVLSGGVSTIDDIAQCAGISQSNFDGVIIGKALYENRFKLSDAVRLAY